MVESFVIYITKEKRYSPNTVLAYKNDIQQCDTFLQESYNISIPEAQKNHFRSWVAHLANENLSPASIHRKVTAVSSFVKYLLKTNIIEVNPLRGLSLPKKPKRLTTHVGREAIERFSDQILHTKDYVGIRDDLIFEMLYQTGMRLSELISLKPSQIDWDRHTIKVIGKRNKERYIPYGDDLKEKMREFDSCKKKFFADKPIDNEFILLESGKKLYPKFVYRVINSYLSILTNLEKKSPHVMRHTFATHLLEEGAALNSIKELLGHSSLSSTQIYTHSSLAKIRKIYKNSHPKS